MTQPADHHHRTVNQVARHRGVRDFLAHHYFDTSPEVVQAVIDKDLDPLLEAVTRMRGRLRDSE